MNYRIAVCEDEPAMRRHLSALCAQTLEKLDIPGMSNFSSAEELVSALQSQMDPAFLTCCYWTSS